MIKDNTEITVAINNIAIHSQSTSAATQQVAASTEEQLAVLNSIAEHADKLKNIASQLSSNIEKLII